MHGIIRCFSFCFVFRTLRKSHAQHILMSLCVALALLLVVFIVGAFRLGGLPGCRAVAALLHYFVLAVVMWMGVEGYQMYLAFVQVYATYQRRFMLKVSVVAWGGARDHCSYHCCVSNRFVRQRAQVSIIPLNGQGRRRGGGDPLPLPPPPDKLKL